MQFNNDKNVAVNPEENGLKYLKKGYRFHFSKIGTTTLHHLFLSNFMAKKQEIITRLRKPVSNNRENTENSKNVSKMASFFKKCFNAGLLVFFLSYF